MYLIGEKVPDSETIAMSALPITRRIFEKRCISLRLYTLRTLLLALHNKV